MRTAHESQPFVNLYKLLQTELNLTIFENKYEHSFVEFYGFFF